MQEATNLLHFLRIYCKIRHFLILCQEYEFTKFFIPHFLHLLKKRTEENISPHLSLTEKQMGAILLYSIS